MKLWMIILYRSPSLFFLRVGMLQDIVMVAVKQYPSAFATWWWHGYVLASWEWGMAATFRLAGVFRAGRERVLIHRFVFWNDAVCMVHLTISLQIGSIHQFWFQLIIQVAKIHAVVGTIHGPWGNVLEVLVIIFRGTVSHWWFWANVIDYMGEHPHSSILFSQALKPYNSYFCRWLWRTSVRCDV